MASGVGTTRIATVVMTVAWIALCIQAPWLGWPVYVAVVAQLAWMARRIGRFGVMALVLYPIPLAAFLAIIVRSSYLTYVRRRVTWKGRELKPSA